MQLSHYVITFPTENDPDHLIVFSIRKVSKIRLSKKAFRRIADGALSSDEIKTLSDLGILVTDRNEERASVVNMFARMNAGNFLLDIIAVMNLDCNFSCVYCYEGAPAGNRYMSRHTADRMIEFIRKRLTPDIKELVVDFYGGEPLLSRGLIEYIGGALTPLAEARGVDFGFTLVTNGSLLKRPVVERLVPLGLKSAKITLDGPAHVHDRYRPFKSGAGSFNSIIRNIKDTCDLIKISVGGNFDRDTWPEFSSLLDLLEHAGLTPDVLYSVKFDPIVPPASHPHMLEKYHGGCTVCHEPWILEAEGVLRAEILKRGYYIPKVQPIMCAIENQDTFVVNFDGRLYKCPAFAGNADYAVGDVDRGVTDDPRIYRLDIWKNKACLECVYLPLCFGGCRYLTFVRDGGISAVDCKKQYFDAALETLVKQEIAYARKTPCQPKSQG